jgi:hypothetical protein
VLSALLGVRAGQSFRTPVGVQGSDRVCHSLSRLLQFDAPSILQVAISSSLIVAEKQENGYTVLAVLA